MARHWIRTLETVLLTAVACTGRSDTGRDVWRTATSLVLTDSVHWVDSLAREPMVVQHPDGALFLAGYGATGPDTTAPPLLWKSDDGGTTWSRVNVGTREDGAMGNSDVDLAVARDGTLYFVAMGFNWETGEGTHIAIGVSHDTGATWTWTSLSQHRFDDRPWVEVAPDGTAHVIWNDGSGVCHAVSTDGGVTWVEKSRVSEHGGSSHLAVGPHGEVAVRITPLSASGNRSDPGVDRIAVSTDRGDSWTAFDAPGERVWGDSWDPDSLIRWVEPIAWDAAGALYSLWSTGAELWLGRSDDRGAHWDTWPVARDDERIEFPYLVGGDAGEVAATWFSGRRDSLRLNLAAIVAPGEGASAPRVLRGVPLTIDAWSRDGRLRDTGGEYAPVVILADRTLGVATPIQNAQEGRAGFSWWHFTAR